MTKTLLMALVGLCAASAAQAVVVPQPADSDSRVRVIQYDRNQVIRINVAKGAATHIVLDENEKILMAAPGYGADCKKDDQDWCVYAEKGDSDIWVKPKSGATEPNNLELKTSKRNYSFLFEVVSLTDKDNKKKLPDTRMFRVTMEYPDDAKKASVAETAKATVAERLAVPAKPKNWNYTYQALKGSSDIAPTMAFDDGRFTYLKFPSNRQKPQIFSVAEDGSESLVERHWSESDESGQKDMVVLHRVYRKLVLRMDSAVVGIWNESYDPDGVAPVDGVSVDGVKRVLKGK